MSFALSGASHRYRKVPFSTVEGDCQDIKRIIATGAAVLVAIAMVPVQAFATETDNA